MALSTKRAASACKRARKAWQGAASSLEPARYALARPGWLDLAALGALVRPGWLDLAALGALVRPGWVDLVALGALARPGCFELPANECPNA